MTNTKNAAALATLAQLAERFPRCIYPVDTKRRPLKIGIAADIIAAVGNTIAPAAVKAALRVYAGSTGYLSRVLTGAWRLDLAGDKADVVTADDEAHAKARLAERTARKAKRAAVAASAAATLTESPAAIIAKPAPAAPIATPAPRGRIGLADLREAARRRREAAARTTGQQPSSDPLGP
jgi:sRNA-binding protein